MVACQIRTNNDWQNKSYSKERYEVMGGLLSEPILEMTFEDFHKSFEILIAAFRCPNGL